MSAHPGGLAGTEYSGAGKALLNPVNSKILIANVNIPSTSAPPSIEFKFFALLSEILP